LFLVLDSEKDSSALLSRALVNMKMERGPVQNMQKGAEEINSTLRALRVQKCIRTTQTT
jgi:hypothetical protein